MEASNGGTMEFQLENLMHQIAAVEADIPTVLQWVASITGIAGAWYVSGKENTEHIGWYIWLASNVAFIAFALLMHFWPIALMQAYFSVTSVRGIIKTHRRRKWALEASKPNFDRPKSTAHLEFHYQGEENV